MTSNQLVQVNSKVVFAVTSEMIIADCCCVFAFSSDSDEVFVQFLMAPPNSYLKGLQSTIFLSLTFSRTLFNG